MRRWIFVMLCCLVFAEAYGQQEGDVDTVNVMGAISNHHTGEPEPFCLVQFLDGERLVAGTMSDEKGNFSVETLPAGSYTLKVLSGGMSLYQQDLLIDEMVMLNISIIKDSTVVRVLPEARVSDSAIRNRLGPLLITSPQDIRLWHFNYRPWVPGPRPKSHEASMDLSRGDF